MKNIYLASSVALMAAAASVSAAPTETPGLPGIQFTFDAHTSEVTFSGSGGGNVTCQGVNCKTLNGPTGGNGRGSIRNTNPMDLSIFKDITLDFAHNSANTTFRTVEFAQSSNTNFSYSGDYGNAIHTVDLNDSTKYVSLRQTYGSCCLGSSAGGFVVKATYINQDASVSISSDGSPFRGENLTAVISDANGVNRATSGKNDDSEYEAFYIWSSEENGILQQGPSNTYEIQFSDSNTTINVEVSYYDDHAYEESEISSTSGTELGYLGDGAVTVSGQSGANGEPSVGDILIPSTDPGPGDQILTAPIYTWIVGTDNRGTFAEYEVVSSDFENSSGSTITVVSNFTDDNEGQESVSTETLAVIRADDTLGTLSVAGKSKVGLDLSADLEDTDGIEEDSVVYAWQKFDAITDIAFGPQLSSDAIYTVDAADIAANNGNPAYIGLTITYTDKLGYEQTLSAQSDTVYLNLAGEVAIDGLTEVGQTLTAQASDEDGIDGDVIYNWYQADNAGLDENVRLLSSNSSTLDLLPLSEGKFVWVEASFFDVDGTEETPSFTLPAAIDPEGTTPPVVAPSSACVYNADAKSLDMLMLLLAACGLFYFRQRAVAKAQ